MSVKISDIIWTVICFGLFALVIDRLLLKPILKFMDARKARIERAGVLAREAEERAEEAERERLLKAEEARLLHAQKRRDMLECARAEAAEAVKKRASELQTESEENKTAAAKLGCDTRRELMRAVDGLAEAFAEKLVSGGQG